MRLLHVTLAALLAGPTAAGAASFDGKSTVICATIEAVNCFNDNEYASRKKAILDSL